MAEAGHGHGINRRGFVAGMVALLGSVIGAIIGLPAVGYLLSPALKKSKTESDDWIPLGLVDDVPVDEPAGFQRQQVEIQEDSALIQVEVTAQPIYFIRGILLVVSKRYICYQVKEVIVVLKRRTQDVVDPRLSIADTGCEVQLSGKAPLDWACLILRHDRD